MAAKSLLEVVHADIAGWIDPSRVEVLLPQSLRLLDHLPRQEVARVIVLSGLTGGCKEIKDVIVAFRGHPGSDYLAIEECFSDVKTLITRKDRRRNSEINRCLERLSFRQLPVHEGKALERLQPIIASANPTNSEVRVLFCPLEIVTPVAAQHLAVEATVMAVEH